jgi:putative colanic acid biosynthesis UDP-glucose lipid carrier transferase
MIAAEARNKASVGEIDPPSGPTLASTAWNGTRTGVPQYSASVEPLRLLAGGVIFGDGLAVILASAVAHMLRNGDLSVPIGVASTTLLAAALMLEVMRGSGAYSRHVMDGLAAQLCRALRNWSVVFALLLALGYVTKTSEAFSRVWASAWYLGALGGFALARIVAMLQVERWRRCGRLARMVAVIDMGGNGDALARQIVESGGADTHLLGVFSAHSDRSGGIDDLIRLTRLFRVDDIIVDAMGGEEPEIGTVVRRLGTIPTNVHLCTSFLQAAFPRQEPRLLFGSPVLTIYRRPLTGWGVVVKRAEDLALGVLLLFLFLPLMLAIAAAIKLDSTGPVLFRQKRLGFNNNAFEILKFRTMIHMPGPELVVPQAQRNDPRVTRVGRFLRRTSLDELPQLLNVLMGTMSLVGPRPHALAHNAQYAAVIGGYLGRHRVQPGITGWAQVNGLRGETDTLEKMQHRIDYDLAYIENWSLLLDLKILFMTVLFCFSSRNAY